MEPSREPVPRLVYDDVCGFCTWCGEFAAARGSFELVGFSELTDEQLGRLPDDYEECTHLLTDDEVYSCGEAVAEAGRRLETPVRYPLLAVSRLPGSERLREPIYRIGASNRDLFGKVLSREPPARTES